MQKRDSYDCVKSELDLFWTPPVNSSVLNGIWSDYHPSTAISKTGPIEFKIDATPDYLDLSKTVLYVQLSVEKAGSIISNTDIVAPTNNLLHSLFSQVDVILNNDKIETSNDTYPYKAYLTDLLNFGQDAKKSIMQSSLFVKDTPGFMDSLETDKTKGNEGFIERRNQLIKGKGTIDLCGKIHSDILNSNKYLLNGVEMKIKLTRSSNEFCLQMAEDSIYTINIKEAILFIRKVSINSSIVAAQSLALEKSHAKYPIKRVEVSDINIPSGSVSATINSINQTIIPNRIIVGFVSSAAAEGAKSKNPFNFYHYNITEIGAYLDGVSTPYSSPLTLNFSNNSYIRGFYSLFENIDKPVFITGNDINRDDYLAGYTLFAFDFTPDLCSGDHMNIIKTGSVSLKIKFASALSESVTAIVYQEYDELVEINKQRKVVNENLIKV
jgi:hypothetical protein